MRVRIDSKSNHWSALTTVGNDINVDMGKDEIRGKQMNKFMDSIKDSDIHKYSDTLHPSNIKRGLRILESI